LGEPVGFRVLDIKAHGISTLLYHSLPFFIIARLIASIGFDRVPAIT
jgi:hypothetical protein